MTVKNLSILSTVPGADVAIQVLRPDEVSSIESGLTLEDIEIQGDDPSVNAFGVGIDLFEAWNTHIDRVAFRGRNGQVTSTALQIRGQSTPVTTRAFDVYWAKYGVRAVSGAFSEGFIGDYNQRVAVEPGYSFENGVGAPLGESRGGHTNSFLYGVRAVNRNSIKVSGHTVYKRTDSTQNYVGVQVEGGCPTSDVTACNLHGFKGQAAGGTLTAPWVNAAGYVPAGYHLDALGDVSLRGVVSGGADYTTAFQLPAAFRPRTAMSFVVPAAEDSLTFAVVQIATNGNVIMHYAPGGKIFLNGIKFRR